jgi:hypothetical protein
LTGRTLGQVLTGRTVAEIFAAVGAAMDTADDPLVALSPEIVRDHEYAVAERAYLTGRPVPMRHPRRKLRAWLHGRR